MAYGVCIRKCPGELPRVCDKHMRGSFINVCGTTHHIASSVCTSGGRRPSYLGADHCKHRIASDGEVLYDNRVAIGERLRFLIL